MKNPNRKSVQTRQSFYSLSAILGMFLAAGTVAPADAGVVTSDSPAWKNQGATVELGTSYRSFERAGTRKETRVREVPVAAVYDEHHVLVTPATTRHERYTVTLPTLNRFNSGSGNVTVMGRPFGSDFLAGVGYDQTINGNGSLYGQGSIRNGRLVGTLGSTLNGKLSGTVAYTLVPNVATFVDFRNGGNAYGAQYQAGDVAVFGACSPVGYSFGISAALGSTPAATKAAPRVNAPAPLLSPVKTAPAPLLVPVNSDFVKGRG
jgi:hypothetical protein